MGSGIVNDTLKNLRGHKMKQYTHKETGWKRQVMVDGSGGVYRIIPTDGTGDRVVDFVDGNMILKSGDKLPEWAEKWVTDKYTKQMQVARDNFRNALENADMYQSMQDAWSY